jgi:hypothetical protein
MNFLKNNINEFIYFRIFTHHVLIICEINLIEFIMKYLFCAIFYTIFSQKQNHVLFLELGIKIGFKWNPKTKTRT